VPVPFYCLLLGLRSVAGRWKRNIEGGDAAQVLISEQSGVPRGGDRINYRTELPDWSSAN
jgi:hypothetical protein